jgi:hypothetical protein
MKVQRGKDLANHSARESGVEALTGETGGSAIEPRNPNYKDANAVKQSGRQHGPGR